MALQVVRVSSADTVEIVKIGSGVSSASIKHPFGEDEVVPFDKRRDWSPRHRKVVEILESKAWEVTMAAIILVNAIFVIHDTDLRARAQPDVPLWLYRSLNGMLMLYVVDLVLRLVVYKKCFFRNRWNVLDFVTVLADLTFEFLHLIDVGFDVSICVLRVFRLFRLLRFVQVLSVFEELYTMLHLMLSAFRAILWGATLMAVMLTISSVVAVEVLHPLNRHIAETTDAYAGCDRCPRAFESVAQANLTFFQHIIAGDSWGAPSIVLIEHYPWTAVFLMAVLVMIHLGLLNLILTVIVDQAHNAREANIQEQLRSKQQEFHDLHAKFLKICSQLDADGSGELTLKELMSGYDNVPEFSDTLKLLDLRKEDILLVFKIMDEDRSGKISYEEFVYQLYRMKNQQSNPFSTLCYMKGCVDELNDAVSGQLKLMDRKLHKLLESVQRATQNAAEAISDISSHVALSGAEIAEARSDLHRADFELEKMQVQVDGLLGVDDELICTTAISHEGAAESQGAGGLLLAMPGKAPRSGGSRPCSPSRDGRNEAESQNGKVRAAREKAADAPRPLQRERSADATEKEDTATTSRERNRARIRGSSSQERLCSPQLVREFV